MSFDDDATVTPDGVRIRGLRRSRGWSRRALVEEIAEARYREAGLRDTITVNELEGIEECNEAIPYAVLCKVASGLDCNPMEILLGAGDEVSQRPLH